MVGATVKVKGMQDPAGTIVAQRITVQSADGPSRETKFIGAIRQLPASGLMGAWLVGDRTVNVDDGTEIRGNRGKYRVGTVVKIHGQRLTDGTVTADEIDLADDEENN